MPSWCHPIACRWAVSDPSSLRLRTNDQLFSLTDQLNMGVRSLELDTHWVEGTLRIAHCGGLHVDLLNKLVSALNFVAKLLHKHIRWDTETMGCSPSLSSIPTGEQRLLEEALHEVAAWLAAPQHHDDFVMLYFDDQADLETWVRCWQLGGLLLDVGGDRRCGRGCASRGGDSTPMLLLFFPLRHRAWPRSCRRRCCVSSRRR